MKKLVSSLVLSMFVSGVAFGDIFPCHSNERLLDTTVKVQGLKNGKTANGSVLVLVVDTVSGRRTVTKVQNNVPISKGYKFNQARLFFVSAALLKEVGNNINKIDFDGNGSGGLTSSSAATIFKGDPIVDSSELNNDLTVAPIDLPSSTEPCVDRDSPLNSRSVIYTIK
ncbi:MAG: hypothetical protein PHN45_00355 [Methylococcales bacterium]|nr:hypothetical protein [Methylococcales bacterium]MDD5753191.1 hypothetical protein [Methylococcales bacterium]